MNKLTTYALQDALLRFQATLSRLNQDSRYLATDLIYNTNRYYQGKKSSLQGQAISKLGLYTTLGVFLVKGNLSSTTAETAHKVCELLIGPWFFEPRQLNLDLMKEKNENFKTTLSSCCQSYQSMEGNISSLVQQISQLLQQSSYV